MFTALAISKGINGKDSFYTLETLDILFQDVAFLGVNYSVYQMYDQLYPQMDPIYCIGPSNSYPIGLLFILILIDEGEGVIN